MNIYLTFDYELFFGENSGTVQKCMLEPTDNLLEIALNKAVYYTFFVDVGYLIQAEKYPELKGELKKVKEQIKRMVDLGHSVQLHVHPHWEKSKWKDGSWNMNVDRNYKLADFSNEERVEIVGSYKKYLEQITSQKVSVFRAGGWCVQPFIELKEALTKAGVFFDTSVIHGAFLKTNNYNVDFRNAPLKSSYTFEDDVTVEDPEGNFTEYPISSYRYRPSFYWWLYGLGRLFPSKHKMIGDGTFLSQGNRKWNVLFNSSTHHVSSDGYFAKKLSPALERAQNMGFSELVVIGHPKGNTIYSINRLTRFIELNEKKHVFSAMNFKVK